MDFMCVRCGKDTSSQPAMPIDDKWVCEVCVFELVKDWQIRKQRATEQRRAAGFIE